MKYHCLFEQSGTFKNVLKSMGHEAYDYDILNDFGETDYQIDLFEEIEKSYRGGQSVFDEMKGDTVLAFFPCVRFEDQIQLYFRGTAIGQKNWTSKKKLEYDLKLHEGLAHNYELITKLALLAYRKNFKLIIENPYSTQHYLQRYWCLKPQVIDLDRSMHGDYFKKPTQFWFINCEPKNDLHIGVMSEKIKKVMDCNTVERSMIHPDYARYFIESYVGG